MSGKCRLCLRQKTLENVAWCNLSQTDKNCIKAVFDKFEEQQAEIERLKELTDAYFKICLAMTEEIEKAKAEAVKEFAERLKEFKLYVGNSQGVFITDEDIDNLLKEMVGDA